MEPIRSYRDLRVWQMGMTIAESCYRLTATFPREELFGMAGQIRRASASIPANIAEGYGRGSRGAYIQFLKVARGSLRELETHLLLAVRVGLVSEASVDATLSQCDEEGRMLASLISKVEPGFVREPETEYALSDDPGTDTT